MAIGITAKPYQDMIEFYSKSLTRTPVTKTTDNISGAESFADGTDVTINGAFYRNEYSMSQENIGLFKGADAILKVLPSVTINFNDKITYDSEVFRVGKEPTTRRLGTTSMYKVVRLFLI